MTEREQKLRAAMLLIAQVFLVLKVREQGGQNRGQVVEAFLRAQPAGRPGMPWCVAFVAWVHETASMLHGVPRKIDMDLSCSDAVNKASKAGLLIKAEDAKTGDMFVIRGGPTGYQHIGMIAAPLDAQGYFQCIEGNTNSAGSAEGDGVYKKRRKASSGVVISVRP